MRAQKGKKTAWIKTERESRKVVSYFNSLGPQVQLSHSVFLVFLAPMGWQSRKTDFGETLTPQGMTE